MKKNIENIVKSILIVDDDENSLKTYASLLEKMTSSEVTAVKYPGMAESLARRHFYDFILIDVTMSYRGSQFGGFEVYKNLKNRYGNSSLLLYSHYVTDDLLKQYGYDFNFIERKEDSIKFIQDILKEINALRKKQTCFIAMPFSREYYQLFQVIKKSVIDAQYKCIRVDEQEFTHSIIQKIFSEIENAKLIIFLATGKNPNAFYECGYSVALNKEVITLTERIEDLPFDIRDRNAIAYSAGLSDLDIQLKNKLNKLTYTSI